MRIFIVTFVHGTSIQMVVNYLLNCEAEPERFGDIKSWSYNLRGFIIYLKLLNSCFYPQKSFIFKIFPVCVIKTVRASSFNTSPEVIAGGQG